MNKRPHFGYFRYVKIGTTFGLINNTIGNYITILIYIIFISLFNFIHIRFNKYLFIYTCDISFWRIYSVSLAEVERGNDIPLPCGKYYSPQEHSHCRSYCMLYWLLVLLLYYMFAFGDFLSRNALNLTPRSIV